MKSIVTAAVAVLLGTGAAAAAHGGSQGFYGTIQGGAVFADADEIPGFYEVDTGVAVTGAVGYAFGSGFRLEGEIGWRHVEAGPVFVEEDNFYSFFANALYEFPVGPIRPYVGAGAGLAVADVSATLCCFFVFEDTATSFAYQIIGGLAIPVSPNMDIVADYRYTATEGLDFFGFDYDVEAHNVMGGVRFRF